MFRKKIKPVFSNRVHFTLKGILRDSFIILLYWSLIFAYFSIVQSIAYFQYGIALKISPSSESVFQVLFLFIIPPIIALTHIIYRDTGNLFLKSIVWNGTFIILVVIPVIIFI